VQLSILTIAVPSCSVLVFRCLIPPPPSSTLFPYTTLFRSPMDPAAWRIALSCHPTGSGSCSSRWTAVAFGYRVVWCPSTARMLRSEEHTSELQSRENLVCRLLLEKKKKTLVLSNAGRANIH